MLDYRIYIDGKLVYSPHDDSYAVYDPKLELVQNDISTFEITLLESETSGLEIERMLSRVEVDQGDFVLFRGTVIEDERTMENEVTLKCKDDLFFLSQTIQRPATYGTEDAGVTAESVFRSYIENHNTESEHKFTIGTVSVNATVAIENSEYQTTWNAVSALVSSCGGFLSLRYEGDAMYLDWVRDFSEVAWQEVRFASNLREVQISESGQGIATVLIPTGKTVEKSVTSTNADGEEEQTTTSEITTIESVNDGKDYIEDEDAVKKYGRIMKHRSYESIEDPEKLLKRAKSDLAQLVKHTRTIAVKIVDLAGADDEELPITLGRYVIISDPLNGINDKYLPMRISRDLFNPAENEIELTSSKSTQEATAFSSDENQATAGFTDNAKKRETEYTQAIKAQKGQIDDLRARALDVSYMLTAYSARIKTLEAETAKIDELEANMVTADQVSANYMRTDAANIEKGVINTLIVDSTLLKNAAVRDGVVTGELNAVTVNGDLITANTIKADRIVVLGDDGLYYKLNTDGIKVEAEQTDDNSLNGEHIQSKTITASKVNVSDLSAFEATIGKSVITSDSIYGNTRTAYDSGTGYYLGSAGTFGVGKGKDSYITFDGENVNIKGNVYLQSGKTVESEVSSISSSVSDAAESASKASESASQAVTAANEKNKTYSQASEPTSGMAGGDIWINTSDGNRIYRYDGTQWTDAQDTAIATANTNASNAVSTANTASTNASTALSTANTAKSTADTAKSTADSAKTTADSAKTTANEAAKESVTLYYASNSTTAPSKPTAQVTATDNKTGIWTLTKPDLTDTYKYLYYCTQNNTANGYTWGTVYRDYGTTSAKEANDATQSDLDAYKTEVTTTYATKSALSATNESISAEVTARKETDTKITNLTTNLSNNYSTTEEMNSAIKASADSITSSVSKTYSTKDDVSGLESRVSKAETSITQNSDSITTIISDVSEVKETADTANSTASSALTEANTLSTMIRETSAGIEVGKTTDGKTYSTNRALVSSSGAFQVLSKDGTVLANFDEDSVDLAKNMTSGEVTFFDGLSGITSLYSGDGSSGYVNEIRMWSKYSSASSNNISSSIVLSPSKDGSDDTGIGIGQDADTGSVSASIMADEASILAPKITLSSGVIIDPQGYLQIGTGNSQACRFGSGRFRFYYSSVVISGVSGDSHILRTNDQLRSDFGFSSSVNLASHTACFASNGDGSTAGGVHFEGCTYVSTSGWYVTLPKKLSNNNIRVNYVMCGWE